MNKSRIHCFSSPQTDQEPVIPNIDKFRKEPEAGEKKETNKHTQKHTRISKPQTNLTLGKNLVLFRSLSNG